MAALRDPRERTYDLTIPSEIDAAEAWLRECQPGYEALERDPDNGMLVGPDGCHYANEHQAAHFGLLQLCGCGMPEEAFNFCRDVLACFDRRGCHDKPPTREWINAEDAVAALVRQRPEEAAHVLAHLLTHLDLLKHGGSVGGSWLTDNGERIVDLGPMTAEVMDQKE